MKYLVTQIQGKRITKKTTIDSVSRLAMKLTSKELATGASESSAELLQALDTVAKMLGNPCKTLTTALSERR